MESSFRQMRSLEDASRIPSPVHALHPAAKLWATLVFLGVTASFVRQDPVRLLPLFLYPVVLTALSGVPLRLLLRPFLTALPFILLLGLAEPFLDRSPALLMGLPFTKGGLSFLNIVLRLTLAVSGALLLAATTPADAIINTLSSAGLPRVLTTQFLLLHRFSHLLGLSIRSGLRAVLLRSGSDRIPVRAWGSFTGRILLRSFDRADRVHAAMLSRGFAGTLPLLHGRSFTIKDAAYALSWTTFCLTVRLFDIPSLLERILP